MKKILTISIAAYNVEKYIEKALDSLLIENIDDVEILVEDDGGTDNTANIVKEYTKKYPNIIKLVHKKNGGYGSTINKSIELATGKYFKQLDGDDMFGSENFSKFLEILRKTDADIIYTPFNKIFEGTNKIEQVDYIPKDIVGQKKIDDLVEYFNELYMMHALTYKTKILKEHKIKITEKCFYTDTEFVLYPLLYTDNIYISHKPLYLYRIGREGQSVSLDGRLKHYNDHIIISNKLLDFWNKYNNKMPRKKYNFYNKFINTHICITLANFLLLLKPNKKNLEMIKNYEKNIKLKNKEIFDSMTKNSKIIFLLRKSNYKLYKLLSILQRKRFK